VCGRTCIDVYESNEGDVFRCRCGEKWLVNEEEEKID